MNTTRIKALLVDDEADNRELLRNMLCDFPVIEVTGEASNVEQAYALVCATAPQLVFLDIQMPSANGFNLLKKFDTVPFEVVFVTSYDEYAINAIRFNALDYLLKPLDFGSLEQAIERVRKRLDRQTGNRTQIVNLLYNLDDANQERRMTVHTGENVTILHAGEILHVEAEGRYCHIHTHNGEKHTTARNLKEFEDYFGARSPFIRISRSVIINVSYIKSYSKGEPFIIEMRNGLSFEIPRRKKAEILEKLVEKHK